MQVAVDSCNLTFVRSSRLQFFSTSLSILYSMNCSKRNCVLADTNCVKCSFCSKPFHIACSSISGLTGNNLKIRCTPWLCTVCECAKLGVRKSPVTQPVLDTDYISKINNILSAVNYIQKLVSKHESSFLSLNKKLDNVSVQLPGLGGLVLQCSKIESPN